MNGGRFIAMLINYVFLVDFFGDKSYVVLQLL